MRCLYCGKQLPLLRKLTGGGEFCSDGHKVKYQEEYNNLALTRLLQTAASQEAEAQQAEEQQYVPVAEAGQGWITPPLHERSDRVDQDRIDRTDSNDRFDQFDRFDRFNEIPPQSPPPFLDPQAQGYPYSTSSRQDLSADPPEAPFFIVHPEANEPSDTSVRYLAGPMEWSKGKKQPLSFPCGELSPQSLGLDASAYPENYSGAAEPAGQSSSSSVAEISAPPELPQEAGPNPPPLTIESIPAPEVPRKAQPPKAVEPRLVARSQVPVDTKPLALRKAGAPEWWIRDSDSLEFPPAGVRMDWSLATLSANILPLRERLASLHAAVSGTPDPPLTSFDSQPRHAAKVSVPPAQNTPRARESVQQAVVIDLSMLGDDDDSEGDWARSGNAPPGLIRTPLPGRPTPAGPQPGVLSPSSSMARWGASAISAPKLAFKPFIPVVQIPGSAPATPHPTKPLADQPSVQQQTATANPQSPEVETGPVNAADVAAAESSALVPDGVAKSETVDTGEPIDLAEVPAQIGAPLASPAAPERVAAPTAPANPVTAEPALAGKDKEPARDDRRNQRREDRRKKKNRRGPIERSGPAESPELVESQDPAERRADIRRAEDRVAPVPGKPAPAPSSPIAALAPTAVAVPAPAPVPAGPQAKPIREVESSARAFAEPKPAAPAAPERVVAKANAPAKSPEPARATTPIAPKPVIEPPPAAVSEKTAGKPARNEPGRNEPGRNDKDSSAKPSSKPESAAKPASPAAVAAASKAESAAKAKPERAGPAKAKSNDRPNQERSTPFEAPILGRSPDLSGSLSARIPVAVKIVALLVVVVGGGAGYYFTSLSSIQPTKSGPIRTEGQLVPISGTGGWATEWGGTEAKLKERVISFYRPTRTSIDYRAEFDATIQSKGVGWVFRAQDPYNYHAAKIEFQKDNTAATLVRFVVVGGIESQHHYAKIEQPIRVGTKSRVRLDVRGSEFTVSVNDLLVEVWQDSRIRTGGFGLLTERTERAQIERLQVSEWR